MILLLALAICFSLSESQASQTTAPPKFSFWQESLPTAVLIRLYRLEATNQLAIVHYETTAEGTAVPERDFMPTQGDLLFRPGETFGSFVITRIDTDLVEPSKTIGLRLREINGSEIEGSFPVIRNNAIPTTLDVSFQPDIPLSDRALLLPDGGFLEVLDEDTSDYGQSIRGQSYRPLFLMSLDSNGRVRSFVGELGFKEPSATERPNLYLLPGGRVLIAGRFRNFNSVSYPGLVRLKPDLSLDAGFFSTELRQTGEDLSLLLAQENGGLILRVGPAQFIPTAENRVPPRPRRRHTLIRLLDDGRVDSSFQETELQSALADHNALAAVEDAQDRILLTGAFTNINGADQMWLARLAKDGTLDGSFRPQVQLSSAAPEMPLTALPLLIQGKILLAGNFTKVNGSAQDGLARLNVDGSLDESFQPGVRIQSVDKVQILPQGKFLLSGWLGDRITGKPSYTTRRLNSDGTIDPAFQIDPRAGPIWAALSDGRFLASALVPTGDELMLLQPNGARDPGFLGILPVAAPRVVQQAGDRVVLVESSEPWTGWLHYAVRLFLSGAPRATFSLVGATEPFEAAVSSGDLLFGGLGTGDGRLFFTIRRRGDVATPGSVTYQALDGTLVGGKDFAPTTGTVNFNAGEIDRVTSIQLLGGAERRFGTLRLRLTEPIGGEIAGPTMTWVNLPAAPPARNATSSTETATPNSTWLPPAAPVPIRGGSFLKSYAAESSVSGAVEGSSDLKTWTTQSITSIRGAVVNTDSGEKRQFYHIDTSAGAALRRFYRTHASQ